MSFILYPLFILLPHNLRQIPCCPCSKGQDTDTVSTIMITCLFCHVRHHRCRRRRQSIIQYTREVRLLFWPFLDNRHRRRRIRCFEIPSIGTYHDDDPAASDLSTDHRSSRDESVVEPSSSDEDLHPDFGDPPPANAGNMTI